MPKTDIHVKLIGEDGNIFNLLGLVARALRRNRRGDLAKEMTDRVMNSHSYDEALLVLADYVEID